ATYTGILTSASSTGPHGPASPYCGTLPYHSTGSCPPVKSNASVSGVSPTTLSAQVHIRPVSCYALFQWWLLLSQHPGCLRAPTSFHTYLGLGTLAEGLVCFPFDREAYPPHSHSYVSRRGIRSLVDFGNPV